MPAVRPRLAPTANAASMMNFDISERTLPANPVDVDNQTSTLLVESKPRRHGVAREWEGTRTIAWYGGGRWVRGRPSGCKTLAQGGFSCKPCAAESARARQAPASGRAAACPVPPRATHRGPAQFRLPSGMEDKDQWVGVNPASEPASGLCYAASRTNRLRWTSANASGSCSPRAEALCEALERRSSPRDGGAEAGNRRRE